MAVVGIIPAAGRGERLGADGPKALVVCAGRPLLDWSVDVLSGVCDRVVIAMPRGVSLSTDCIEGGRVRSESVRLALSTAPEATIAVVHDAARPLVTRSLVERCVAAVRDEGWDGATAAARMTDTVKETDAAGRVERTLDRSRLWSIQTPQVFRADALRRALDVPFARLASATDDAMLVEAAGGAVRVVEAPRENIKVTTASDLAVAEAALRASS